MQTACIVCIDFQHPCTIWCDLHQTDLTFCTKLVCWSRRRHGPGTGHTFTPPPPPSCTLSQTPPLSGLALKPCRHGLKSRLIVPGTVSSNIAYKSSEVSGKTTLILLYFMPFMPSVKVTVYLQGCLASKRCSVSSLNCRHLNLHIKLKLTELAIQLYQSVLK